jgi:hypothetical protein
MRESFRTFIHRLTALFRRQRLEDDLDEELRSHLEMAEPHGSSLGLKQLIFHRRILTSRTGSLSSLQPSIFKSLEFSWNYPAHLYALFRQFSKNRVYSQQQGSSRATLTNSRPTLLPLTT